MAEVSKQPNEEAQTFENSGNLVDTSGTIETPTNRDPGLQSDLPESPPPAEMDVIQEHSKSPDLSSLLTWLRSEPPLSPERLSTLCVEHNDFETALRVVQPSAKREGFVTVPDVTWDDVGSLQDIRQELQMAILVSTYISYL